MNTEKDERKKMIPNKHRIQNNLKIYKALDVRDAKWWPGIKYTWADQSIEHLWSSKSTRSTCDAS